MPRILSVLPDRSSYRPGQLVSTNITVENSSTQSLQGLLKISFTHLLDVVGCKTMDLSLEPLQATTIAVSWQPPTENPRGYGVDIAILASTGEVLAAASGAFDVLERWSQAPRYGFLSSFGPGHDSASIAEAVHSLRLFHINIVQFYDWMWRHYRLLPPAEEFTDALGRDLSLRTIRESIAAVRAIGAEAYAYGAVYGAEPEFADTHPDLVLYDAIGKRISLADLFFVMDISPKSAWTSMIVNEFAEVIRELDFDGIHLDQYGFPKETAFTRSGDQRNLEHDFPPLIDAARAAVIAKKESAGVIFNLVDNWPVATVAPTTQDAMYIEVWPPYTGYADLFTLIDDAKRLDNGKQVILAAYLTPFLESSAAPESEAAALLATAVIASSGGFHLLLGERHGILCDPYYPKYGTLREDFVPRLASYYDHLVRYEEWLTDPAVLRWEVEISGASFSTVPEPGKIWAIARRRDDARIVHLIDLRDQTEVLWNAPRTPWSCSSASVEITIPNVVSFRACHFLSPDLDHGRPQLIQARSRGLVHFVRVSLPGPWSTLVFTDAIPNEPTELEIHSQTVPQG